MVRLGIHTLKKTVFQRNFIYFIFINQLHTIFRPNLGYYLSSPEDLANQ